MPLNIFLKKNIQKSTLDKNLVNEVEYPFIGGIAESKNTRD